MNVDLLFQLKQDFQILIEQMKVILEKSDDVSFKIAQLDQLHHRLKSINKALKSEREQHKFFGELDKINLIFNLDQKSKEVWYKYREKHEKLLKLLIAQTDVLTYLLTKLKEDREKDWVQSSWEVFCNLLNLMAFELQAYDKPWKLSQSPLDLEKMSDSLEVYLNQLRNSLTLKDRFKNREIYQFILELEEYLLKLQVEQQEINGYKNELQRQQQEWLSQQKKEFQYQHQQWVRQQQEWLELQKSELQRQQQEWLIQQKVELENAAVVPQDSKPKAQESKPRKTRSFNGISLLFLILVVTVLGSVGLVNQNPFKFRQKINILSTSQNIEENLKSAQTLALEASEIVENPPHPLTVWQAAQNKWSESIRLLKEIYPHPAHSQFIEKKLNLYQSDYESVQQKLEKEQSAVAQFKTAKKIALEASGFVKNPPYPLSTWQKAQDQWQKAINLLETIPQDSFVAPEVQDKLEIYRLNSEEIDKRMIMQQQAQTDPKIEQ